MTAAPGQEFVSAWRHMQSHIHTTQDEQLVDSGYEPRCNNTEGIKEL